MVVTIYGVVFGLGNENELYKTHFTHFKFTRKLDELCISPLEPLSYRLSSAYKGICFNQHEDIHEPHR